MPPQAKAKQMVKVKAKTKAAAKAKAHAKAKAKAKARPARTKNWTNRALEASFSFVFSIFSSSCLVGLYSAFIIIKHVTASYLLNVPVEEESALGHLHALHSANVGPSRIDRGDSPQM